MIALIPLSQVTISMDIKSHHPPKPGFFRNNESGNMLILVSAVIAGIVVFILLFGLLYTRLIGTQGERKSAIQAASLAAAREMSRIVITNSDFGKVGLSDSAPDGSGTQAGDNYYTSVHGINTLFGTTLLDFIIAQELGDTELRMLAEQDLARAKSAADELMVALNDSIQPGGSGVDKHGNTVEPYKSAEDAYKSNQVRMAGNSSYRAGSLQLSLGAIDGGLATNIPTPAGWSGSIPSSATSGNHYRSYQQISRGSQNWVFAGIGDSVKIVDHKKFTNSVSGLAYQHPTIVRAEAIHDLDTSAGQTSLTTVAAAQPASVFDPKPNPGALVISFPDGIPDGTCKMLKILDLYGPCLHDSDDASDMYIARGGDYPTDASANMAMDNSGWPFPHDSLRTGANACKIAVYDWYKRAGTKAQVSQVVNMHSTAFGQPTPLEVAWPPGGHPNKIQIPNGISQIFRFTPSGAVTHQFKNITPAPYFVVSHNQTFFESFEVLTWGSAREDVLEPVPLGPPINDPNGKLTLTRHYDLFIRDYARKPGLSTGGKHAGEPMVDDLVSSNFDAADIVLANHNIKGEASFDTVYDSARGAKRRGSGGAGSGQGGLPLLLPQEDFAFSWNGSAMEILRTPSPLIYRQFPTGSGLRPSYVQNGVVCDIRFRRQVLMMDNPAIKTNIGYIGLKESN